MSAKDTYWLSDNPDFNPEFIFDTATPQRDAQHYGKLQTNVLVDNTKPVAFISYYKQSFYEGKILFLSVDTDHRSKNYGGRLLQHAVNNLLDQGVKVVKLVTRTNNHPALKLYKNLQFTETGRDDTYVSFEKRSQ